MSDRNIKNTAVLVKAGVTYGTDSVPTGTANAFRVSNLTAKSLEAPMVERDLITAGLGISPALPGAPYSTVSFDIEIAGAGTVATAPPFAAALLACAMAQTLTATVRADYLPISTAMGFADIYWYDDGVLHKMIGCRGTQSFSYEFNAIPKISFAFTGLYVGPVTASLPTLTITAWKTPQIVNNINTAGGLVLGATHATATAPAFVGGTIYPTLGLTLDVGQTVVAPRLLGSEVVEIDDRRATGELTLDLTAAQVVDFHTRILSGAQDLSIGLIHGTIATQKSGLFMAQPQFESIEPATLGNKRVHKVKFRACPSVAGNDEYRFFISF